MMANTTEAAFNELKNLAENTQKILENSRCLLPPNVKILSTSLERVKISINLANDAEVESAATTQSQSDCEDEDRRRKENDPMTIGSPRLVTTISKEAPDSCVPNQNPNKVNSRSLRRTISESTDEKQVRGILKYPRNWNRRTVSESNCDMNESDDCFFGSLDIGLEEEGSSNEALDVIDEEKLKKCVRFNEHVYKAIFRKNSSILGRKNKNRKRAKNRKNSRCNKNADGSENKTNDIKIPNSRSRQDSGYDSDHWPRSDLIENLTK